LSVCRWRNKRKLVVCKRTKRTRRTCPSMWVSNIWLPLKPFLCYLKSEFPLALKL
jgi:hypothetical protein